MFQRIQLPVLVGFIGLTIAASLASAARATMENEPGILLAQSASMSMQGRGIAQGSAFTGGRTANTALTIDGNSFGLEIVEPPGTRARVQYRGAVIRRNGNSSSFTLDGRVQTFNSTDNLRLRGTTTGTCRIEVSNSIVTSSTCNTVTDNSGTRFLGLEQF